MTTGDSSLSACVQSIEASDVGYPDLAWDYFEQSLYLDLADTHGNTADGVHIANAGGIWAAVVHGFAGLVDSGDVVSLEPRLPDAWEQVRFSLLRHGSDLRITLGRDGTVVEVVSGGPVPIRHGDTVTPVEHGRPLHLPS